MSIGMYAEVPDVTKEVALALLLDFAEKLDREKILLITEILKETYEEKPGPKLLRFPANEAG